MPSPSRPDPEPDPPLVADAALSSHSSRLQRLLEKGEKARAWRVASTIFWLFLLVGSGVTALFILVAPLFMPLFTAPTTT